MGRWTFILSSFASVGLVLFLYVSLNIFHYKIESIHNPNTLAEEKRAKSNGGVIIAKWNIKLFQTTYEDYQANQTYYQKKFGIERYYHPELIVREPRDLRYSPHPSTAQNDLPIIFVEWDEKGRILFADSIDLFQPNESEIQEKRSVKHTKIPLVDLKTQRVLAQPTILDYITNPKDYQKRLNDL